MQKIVPHLWYDKEAKEAAAFYTSVFSDSNIVTTSTIHGTPSGDADIVTINLMGQEFMMISAGPYFTFNPSISFMVCVDSKAEADRLWKELSKGGSVLMELDAYPFSEKYGWLHDAYGLSWQIIYMGERKITQKIIPTLLFVGDKAGKAEEAIHFYTSVFKKAQIGDVSRYAEGQEPDKAGTVAHASFRIEDYEMAAMDSARQHDFTFNEAVSFIVKCETQEEIDYYWSKLSAVPEAEQCGWLKDRYGVSWQIVPRSMDEMMGAGDQERLQRVTDAFLKMKKFDIATLTAAYNG